MRTRHSLQLQWSSGEEHEVALAAKAQLAPQDWAALLALAASIVVVQESAVAGEMMVFRPVSSELVLPK